MPSNRIGPARGDAGRVITGRAGGIRLLGAGPGTRPLGDRAKQALFSVLTSELADGWPGGFLDLFAGSGAAGIEALSRGASRALFVERDPRAAAVIGENLRRAGLFGGTVVRRDALRFLDDDASLHEAPFGAGLLDPPYGDAAIVAALERLGDPGRGWLREDAVMVAKHHWRNAPPERMGSLAAFRERRLGETTLTFYRATLPGVDPAPGSGKAP